MAGSQQELALREYITSSGGFVHADLSLLAEDPAKGRKVVATKDLPKGTPLLKIPTTICLSASPTRATPGGTGGEGDGSIGAFLDSQRKLTPFLKLLLLVMYEKAKGPDSPKAAFLDTLPKSHGCVLAWNSVEKAALAGTSIEEEVMYDIRSTFDKIILPILHSKAGAWPGEWAQYETFQNYYGLVQSRSFYLDGNVWLTGATVDDAELFLIPGVDLVNHSTDPMGRNTSLQRQNIPTGAPSENPAQAADPLAPATETPALTTAAPVSAPAAEPPAPAAGPPAGATETPGTGTEIPALAADTQGAVGITPPGSIDPSAPEKVPSAAEMDPTGAKAEPAASLAPLPATASAVQPPPAEAPVQNGAPAAPTASFFTMDAEVDIPSGMELLHNYGDLGDADLLNIFGFVDTLGTQYANPHNKVYVPTEALVAWCQEQKSGRRLGKNFKRRKDFLRDLGMLPDGFPVTLEEPITDSLITVTQILLMSDMAEFDDLRLELQKLKKKKQSTDILGKDTLDEQEHSMFVCTTILRTIEEQISSFPEIGPPTGPANPNRLAQATHVRAGETQVVMKQKREIQKLMSSLGSEAEEEEGSVDEEMEPEDEY